MWLIPPMNGHLNFARFIAGYNMQHEINLLTLLIKIFREKTLNPISIHTHFRTEEGKNPAANCIMEMNITYSVLWVLPIISHLSFHN